MLNDNQDLKSIEFANNLDPTEIRIEERTVPISLLLDYSNKQKLKGANNLIWNVEEQSRLIESTLVRIPLPSFYMESLNDGAWSILDGHERLASLINFLNNGLRLRGLDFLLELEGRSYDELPKNIQRRILETKIIIFLIREEIPTSIKSALVRRITTSKSL